MIPPCPGRNLKPSIPFAPTGQHLWIPARLFDDLEILACKDHSGPPTVSLQPNAGSQGQYAGLLAIPRAITKRRAGSPGDVCLIPTSAHGTNPGERKHVRIQGGSGGACDANGNIEVAAGRAT